MFVELIYGHSRTVSRCVGPWTFSELSKLHVHKSNTGFTNHRLSVHDIVVRRKFQTSESKFKHISSYEASKSTDRSYVFQHCYGFDVLLRDGLIANDRLRVTLSRFLSVSVHSTSLAFL